MEARRAACVLMVGGTDAMMIDLLGFISCGDGWMDGRTTHRRSFVAFVRTKIVVNGARLENRKKKDEILFFRS